MSRLAVIRYSRKSVPRQCVDAASDRLFDFAKAHPVLEDVVPFSLGMVVRGYARIISWALLLLFGPIGLLMAVQGDVHWARDLLLLAATCAGAGGATVCILPGLLLVSWLSFPRKTTVASGVLTIRADSNWAKSSPLSAVQWFAGTTRHDRYGARFFERRHALILHIQHEVFSNRIAVGLEKKHRALWSAFLQLAGVPRYKSWNE